MATGTAAEAAMASAAYLVFPPAQLAAAVTLVETEAVTEAEAAVVMGLEAEVEAEVKAMVAETAEGLAEFRLAQWSCRRYRQIRSTSTTCQPLSRLVRPQQQAQPLLQARSTGIARWYPEATAPTLHLLRLGSAALQRAEPPRRRPH
eukprot:679170-Prymnesium_polylepis.3